MALLTASPGFGTTAGAAGRLVVTTRRHAVAIVCAGVPNVKRAGDKLRLSARLGDLTATLDGTLVGQPNGYYDTIADPQMSVTDGQLALAPAGVPAFDPIDLDSFALLSSTLKITKTVGSVCVVDLAGMSGPTVLLSMFSGGAHCCSELAIYEPEDVSEVPGHGVLTENFGNPGVGLTVARGKVLLVTGDNDFAYLYTDYADSAFPIEILQFRNLDSDGTIVDDELVVSTRDHPNLVAADAASQWLWSQRRSDDPAGYLAAWAADECNLGRCQMAFATLERLAKSGKVKSIGGGSYGPSWVVALHRFLVQHGYVRR